MFVLIWGLLNVAIFIYAIVLCSKATKYIYAQFGIFAAGIFVLFLLSAATGSGKDENLEPNSNQIKTWKFLPSDSTMQGKTYFKTQTIENELSVRYELDIKYAVDEKTRLAIPIDGSVDQTGFISGTAWQPQNITINKTLEPHLFRYYADGMVNWKLLGVTLYTQGKQFSGPVLLTPSENE
jgi:hypothetical protein